MNINPSRKRRKIIKFLISFIIVLSLIFLLNFFQKDVKSFFYSLSTPVQKFFWQIGDSTSDFLNSLFRINSLKKERDELNLENQELLAEIAILKDLKNENKILREALDVGLQKDFKLILSQVIGKDVSQDFLLIDKGSEDGVSKNMPVITQQKVLLGKISEVYKNSSKVMLISDKKSSFDAKIQEKDISGVVKGEGNFRIIFDLIPQDKEISQGDTIITSSLGGIFPSGILVGQIKNIKKSDVEPFQDIEIKPNFEITGINTLFVVSRY